MFHDKDLDITKKSGVFVRYIYQKFNNILMVSECNVSAMSSRDSN